MPTGKVKWYDAEKGFGFLTSDDGEDVFVHGNSLPAGVTTPQGRHPSRVRCRRRQEGQDRAVPARPRAARHRSSKAKRKPAEDMAIIVETLIKLLDDVGNDLRKGRYPTDAKAQKVAAVLRAVADDLDA